MFTSTSGRWVVGREVGSSKGVAVSVAHSKDLRQLGQLSDWQVYDGKEWGPQAVSIWVDGQEGSKMMHKSSLPPIRVQDGKPVSGPMPRGAGAARTAGAVKERGKGRILEERHQAMGRGVQLWLQSSYSWKGQIQVRPWS